MYCKYDEDTFVTYKGGRHNEYATSILYKGSAYFLTGGKGDEVIYSILRPGGEFINVRNEEAIMDEATKRVSDLCLH